MINVTRSSMPKYEEYCDEIKDLWDTHWLTNMGEKHQKLAKAIEDKFKVEHVMLYTNGHLALEGIWDALNFPRGKEVITTPFTFCSTTHALTRKGLVPVFCDINPTTFCIDANKIEELINENTVAICAVHVYGNICDVEKIEAIAKKHNLVVIYDAAHAFSVKYKGKSSANFGDFTMYSFHATKVFNTIEGGAVCFNGKDDYVELLNANKNFGIHNNGECNFTGFNAKMNEFQAAMGICNLKHLDEQIAQRKKVYLRYKAHLDGIDGINFYKPQTEVTPNYSYLPVVFDNYKKTRDEVFNELKKEDIVARKYFYPLVNDMKCYANNTFLSKKTPIAKYISDRVLCLPMYADLDLTIVDKICEIILK